MTKNMDAVRDRLDDVAGVTATTKRDETLRWDGKQVYVLETTYRRERVTGEKKIDVTAEVARALAGKT